MIRPALLEGRDRYERVMDGWVDNTHEDAFTLAVTLRDDDRAAELSVVVKDAAGLPTGVVLDKLD